MPITLPPPVVGYASGDAALALPGSGEAVPAGIDALIEFNGLILNNRKVVDHYRITEIDGLQDADIRDARENNPSYHGESVYSALYGGRTLTLTGYIIALNLKKLRDMQQALRSAFADLNEHALIFHVANYNMDHQIFCRKMSGIQMREAQTQFSFHRRDFLITLRASNPRFTSIWQKTSSVANVGGSGTMTIRNTGNFRASPRVLLYGPMTNPTIANSVSGEVFAMTGSIPNGGFWEIDTEKRTIYDNLGVNQIDKMNITSPWPELVDGFQNLTVTATGTGAASAMAIYWRDTWM